MEENWLEYLEREKLLFPIYRIVLPKNYSTYISKRYYIPKEGLPLKWHKIRNLTDKIEDSEYSSDVFNVFDKKIIPYKILEIPKNSEFKKWSFKLPNKKYVTVICRQKNYYQHWQVYHLYELTKACTQQYLINVFDEKIFNEIHEKGLNSKKMFRYTIDYKYFYLKFFIENHILFDMLSFYVSSLYKCNSVPPHKLLEYWKIEEKVRKNFEIKREKRIAKITICKYDLKKETIIEFIKFLCNRYFFYENDHMNKLINMVQNDIEHLCKLLEDGFNISTIKLFDEIVRVREHYTRRPLEYILRGEIAEAKDNTFRSLRNIIGKTIKYENSIITEEDVNKFLEFCDTNSMGSIFLEIKRFYFGSQSYYGIIQNLISLTMAFEGFLRIILDIAQINVSGDGLLEVLKSYYKDASWYSEFKNKNNRNIVYQQKDLVPITLEILKKRFHKKDSSDEIIKTLYIVLLLRNKIAHRPFNISFRDKHPSFFKEKVIELLWFSWKYANENFPLAIRFNESK